MPLQSVNSKSAPQAIGPYSQAIINESYIFTSGQIAIDPETNNFIEGKIEDQTEQVIKNLEAVLEEAGSSLENVIKTTVFLRDMNDFATMNSIYERYFVNKPARSTVAVANLPKNALIEIECVAVKNSW